MHPCHGSKARYCARSSPQSNVLKQMLYSLIHPLMRKMQILMTRRERHTQLGCLGKALWKWMTPSIGQDITRYKQATGKTPCQELVYDTLEVMIGKLHS